MENQKLYTPQQLADSKLLVNCPSVWSIRKLIHNNKLEANNFSCATQARWKITATSINNYNANFN